MSRCVVNVATGHYQVGQERLSMALDQFAPDCLQALSPGLHPAWPTHQQKPYAFKAYALHDMAECGFTQLLWADACIVPIRSLEPIWQHAKQHGVWIAANYGYTNYEWTADSAYRDLFPELANENARSVNRGIPHAIATAFALDLTHQHGLEFLDGYYRLASETTAFCGPWTNGPKTDDGRYQLCGPADVRGHRHDQTCASVIAWRLGIPLTAPPLHFAYAGGETEETSLVADGNY